MQTDRKMLTVTAESDDVLLYIRMLLGLPIITNEIIVLMVMHICLPHRSLKFSSVAC